MNTDYIIIQAGGKGTRLEYLTKNKPKAIVSVNNLPILFYLFNKYPNSKFIIIGDYKYDVLKSYLETFANVRYLLIHANGEGNVCGIKKAVSYIPNNQPFMVIWSDLLLDGNFSINNLTDDCYIGTTDKFRCSWRYEGGRLEKVSTETNGVAGFFLFDDKCKLDDIPETGSFTKWLSEKEITLKVLDIDNSKEVGSLEAIKHIDHSNQNRCRPYNKMTFQDGKVIKEGLTKEGKELIKKEVDWYRAVSEHNFSGIPYIYSLEPLIMEKINGENIFKAKLTDKEKRETIDRLVDKLDELHNLEKAKPNVFDMQEDYYTKTLKRLYGIRNTIPFADVSYININGKKCKNVLHFKNDLQDMVNRLLDESADFGIIHGDGTLTNTMIDSGGNIFFIDARGYFGKTPLIGDVYYDWAKLYYSIQGAFDQFNIKNFSLEINPDCVEYKIAPSGWEQFTEYFLQKIPNCDVYRIKLIHAIIWLSLASHCWEDYDSMCLAFYNGNYLWNELLEG